MRKKIIRIGSFCMLLLAFCSLSLFTACQSDLQNLKEIMLKQEFGGKEVDLLSAEVRAYLEAKEEGAQASALTAAAGRVLDGQHLVIGWEGDGSADYSVLIADNPVLNRAYVVQTQDTEITSPGICIPGQTYYYQVKGDDSASKIDSFTVKSGPRLLTVEGASNVRDLGGWAAGETNVAYGKLFRGGKLNEGNKCTLSAEGKKVMMQHLGIRTEIDLRFANVDDGGQSVSVFGTNVTYLKASFHGYNYIVPEFSNYGLYQRSYLNGSTEAIKSIFTLLSKEENYPVYFHCNAGADRTGTLALLINGLLGVNQEDLIRDFELTSFSIYGARYRGLIENGVFVNGVMQDNSDNFVAMGLLIEQLISVYGEKEGSLNVAIENYLTKACGVTRDEIDSIRKILLVN